jgi:hypothetical protein
MCNVHTVQEDLIRRPLSDISISVKNNNPGFQTDLRKQTLPLKLKWQLVIL